MAMETETKYEADASTVLPGLDTLPGVAGTRGPDIVQLEAEYYDTADFRLLRSGITLRRRKGGDDAGWHLKLPAGPASREEIRLVEDGSAALGAFARELIGQAVRDGVLAPGPAGQPRSRSQPEPQPEPRDQPEPQSRPRDQPDADGRC